VRIAIIGSGISGLTAAYLLQGENDITVFESADKVGGHTATVNVDVAGKKYAIDTGFIVYNDWTYPNFIRLMDELGVKSKPTEMSFSVKSAISGLEYGGNNLNTLFAQRKNLFKPSYLKMLLDIMRFNKQALADLDNENIRSEETLGEYLQKNNYGDNFIRDYLIPMGSAIWSSSTEDMLNFPLLFFVRFFKNHGLLSVNNRPQWRVIEGGSSQYLEPLIKGFKEKIHLNTTIKTVRRSPDDVQLIFENGESEHFDQIVMACHSDQALSLLESPSEEEKSVLEGIQYQQNDVVLHTDESLLPKKKLAWSSWNYWLQSTNQSQAVLTYDMNILQRIEAPVTFCVTLNATDFIDPEKILGRYSYSHPVFSLQSESVVQRWDEINGVNRSWFCGAYWANGFHEDGVNSGIRVARALGVKW
jgi:predicted NAD/FAD-binding protein